jgi:hypothetical protein
MATPLDLFPARVALVDIRTGHLTPEGYRAFTTLFERVGGASAPSNSELAISDDDDSGLEEFKAEIAKTLDAFAMQPRSEPDPFADPMHPLVQQHIPLDDPGPVPQEHVRIDEVLTELHGLRELVATLQTQINDLGQGAIYDGNS